MSVAEFEHNTVLKNLDQLQTRTDLVALAARFSIEHYQVQSCYCLLAIP